MDIEQFEAQIRAELEQEYAKAEALINRYRAQVEVDKTHLLQRVKAEKRYRAQLEPL